MVRFFLFNWENLWYNAFEFGSIGHARKDGNSMKLNKSTLRTILSVIIVVIALVGFLQDRFAEAPAAQPEQPQSSQAETLPEAEVPEAESALPEAEPEAAPEEEIDPGFTMEDTLDESTAYSTMQEVADYIHIYGKLPPNFITKNEARDLGWESSEGNLWKVAPGMSIGGDRFGNYEGLLPEADGRTWTECDIDFDGGYRNDKRIVFSNDGLIYYTDDHYESFTQLY